MYRSSHGHAWGRTEKGKASEVSKVESVEVDLCTGCDFCGVRTVEKSPPSVCNLSRTLLCVVFCTKGMVTHFF